MKENFAKRAEALLTVKSIVTLMLTGVFVYLSIVGSIDGQNFMTIFLTVISFYFGTQSQKQADSAKGGEKNA